VVLSVSIVHSSLIDAPIELVFEWHGRPGAFTRLSPPWQPIRIVEEATSLSDGRAVLRLPGGMRWVAQHDPSGYDPPRAFVDELISFPLRSVVPWRHQHQFSSSEGATVVTDRLTTPVPARLLRPMFVYRTPTGRRPGRTEVGPGPRGDTFHRGSHRGIRSDRRRTGGVFEHRRPPGHPTGPARAATA